MKPLPPAAFLLAAALTTQLTVACTASGPAKSPASADTPAAPDSPTTTAAAPAPRATRAAERPKIPSGMTASYAIFDRETGRSAIAYNVHHRFRSASVVKILIALDHLERTSAIPRRDLALLRSMLRSSDDRAATLLWTRGGRTKIVQRMAARLGLTDTSPPPSDKPGYWGYTAISAADLVRTYRYLLDKAPQRIRAFIMGNLDSATRCAIDGFDQYFGIPRALPRPWAVKQGWSGYGSSPPRRCTPTPTTSNTTSHTGGRSRAFVQPVGFTPDLGLGRPVLHTTGTVGAGHRRIVVVLSLQPAGSSWQTATARLTALTRAVYRAGTQG